MVSTIRFKDKVAIVAGGAQGIGQGIAVALGSEGAQVVVCDVKEDGMKETEKQIKDKGGKALAVKVDAFQYDAVKAAVDKVLQQFGQLDIMVCTIGAGVFKPFKDYTPEFWQKQIDLNLKTVFNWCHAVIEPMTKMSYGKMLVFTSTTGGTANLAGYGVGKAGVESLVKTIAVETAAARLNINAIMPGIVVTPGHLEATAPLGPAGEKMREQWLKAPRGVNTADNVAKLALFLLSDEAERINGSVITTR